MKYNCFEDAGQYYANEEMIKDHLVLSMGSGLVYSIFKTENVKIVKKASDNFLVIARAEILKDGLCFYGQASIFRVGLCNSLIWEF